MMKNLFLCLTLVFISFTSSAKTFNSEFGISVELNNDWLALSKNQASDKNKKATIDELKKYEYTSWLISENFYDRGPVSALSDDPVELMLKDYQVLKSIAW